MGLEVVAQWSQFSGCQSAQVAIEGLTHRGFLYFFIEGYQHCFKNLKLCHYMAVIKAVTEMKVETSEAATTGVI